MTPRLVLLAGTLAAVREVWAVLLRPEFGFAVRDYWDAARLILPGYPNSDELEQACEQVRKLVDGEPWLCDQVLRHPGRLPGLGVKWGGHPISCGPDRLAIHAERCPDTLRERVVGWGGEEWSCEVKPHDLLPCRISAQGRSVCKATWPEVIADLLAEA